MSRILGFGLLRKRDEPKHDFEGCLDHASSTSHVPATSGATLLPRPLASAVSLLTQSTSLSLRVGTFFGGVALDGARVTTLTGLELSRAVIESVLTKAGRDTIIRSSGEHGKAEAESLLERSLAALHTTVTSASFFAAATFHLSSTTLSSAAHMSQALLSTLDAILGSTESSRAMTAIITLIRREFRSPNSDIGAENIGLVDLLVGTVGFAMLQRWGGKNTARHMRINGGDETVWDVVILDNGARADVIGMHQMEPVRNSQDDFVPLSRQSSFISLGNDEEAFDAVQRTTNRIDISEGPYLSLPPGDQYQILDEDLRLSIMKQLPQGCRASIRTDLVTARTITVDIFDDDISEIAAPPGTMILEERFHDQCNDTAGIQIAEQLPKYTVVFRTAFNKSQSADVKQDTTSKSVFGRGSLTKLAQKLKPAGAAKVSNNKRSSLRPPLDKSNAPSAPLASTQRSKVSKGSSSEIQLVYQGPPPKVGQEEKPSKISPASRGRVSSPVANRGLPRSPLQDSRLRSAPSPTPRHVSDTYHGRNSRTDYFTVYEENQESFVTQSDVYSLRAVFNDSRPNSPVLHQRSKSYASSIYSFPAADSETSLILAHRSQKSAYDDIGTIQALNRDGLIPGIFPKKHFVENIRRFCRFSSASYGSNALKVMGVPQATRAPPSREPDSQRHSDFSDHAGLPPSTILLSSFADPEGGSNAAGETGTGWPLVHYLCLDHESKAVVLTLRGTWGFEDILTDMTCDYDDLGWQGESWKVHKGMHASAKRLLMGGSERVMITIRAALEAYPDYGVVLCGHSLGGGVAALLATMISEPNSEASGTSFVTASYRSTARRRPSSRGNEGLESSSIAYYLPPGRPIHVYAYGPPSTMSPSLRRATRGLITTVVNGQDVVPSLSLGILHDMHTVSLAFKTDLSGAKSHVRGRVWEGLRQSIVNKFYVRETPLLLHAGDGVGEDAWAWQTLTALREEMRAPKLLPPGDVFVVETMRVLQRNAFTSSFGEDGYPQLGRPATRVQLKFIRDVDTRFGELRFSSGMLSDHNPARYEASLAALSRSILDD